MAHTIAQGGNSVSEPVAVRGQILVVDDDADTAMTFAGLLQELGHTAAWVTSPQRAVDIAKQIQPWLIFLDLGMPGMDGWEVAKRLRRELGRETVRIVAVSGHGEPADHHRSRQAGFDAHVTKPLDMPLLESILAQMS